MKRLSFVTAFLLGVGFSAGVTTVGASILGSSIFPDVPAGSYFDSAVGEMNAAGIINGYDNGNFGPSDPVTRAQIAVLMQRQQHYLLELLGGSVPVSTPEDDPDPVTTNDDDDDDTETVEREENPAGSVRFTTSSFAVDEHDSEVTLTLIRSGGSDGVVSVDYSTVNGDAESGRDFELSSGRLTFADGETSRSFTITIMDDSDNDPDETFTVQLDNPVGGVSIVTPDVATVTIDDNDGSVSTSDDGEAEISFTAKEYALPDIGDEVVVTVVRSSTNGSVSVNYATSDYTASSSDYRDADGTLTFTEGQKEQQFSVFIEDDSDVNGDRIINLRLTNPTGGAVLGHHSTAQIRIIDDERDGVTWGSGSLRFTDSTFEADETAGVGYVEVSRTNGANGQVTVKYRTSNGTAISGTDYVAQSGSLTFKDGEHIKYIGIPVLDDSVNDSGEYFNVIIEEPTGASLGSPTTTQLEIQ